MKLAFLAFLACACSLSACGSKDSAVEPTATPTVNIAKSDGSTTSPVALTQPTLPSDWQAKFNSWPAGVTHDNVWTCINAADAAITARGQYQPYYGYSHAYCGCVVAGMESYVYYPTDPPVYQAWVDWCTYAAQKKLVKDIYLQGE